MGGQSPTPILVQKYGGSSLATPKALQMVAQGIVARHRAGHRMVVVVSAMGRTTEALLAQGRALSKQPPRRELDMLMTAGERICMALLCIAIDAAGAPAISLTGSQSGIITDTQHQGARILAVDPWRIHAALARGQIAVVAGYQGVSRDREITTLGRGGSDTTAVALAAALDAEACEIYSDVDGVFSADPNLMPQARLLADVDYDTMQALSELGAKVLNAQAVAFAKRAQITILARRTHNAAGPQTRIGAAVSGRHHLAGPVAVAQLPVVSRLEGAWLSQAAEVHERLAHLSARVLASEMHGLWLDGTNMVDAGGTGLAALATHFNLQMTTHGWASLVGDGPLSAQLPGALAALTDAHIGVQAIITQPQALCFAVAPPQLLQATRALHTLL